MPSFAVREKNIAHTILRTVLTTPQQESFVAFVGREHLISVARNMLNFMNQGETFLNYQRPTQVIESPTDPIKRQDLIKKFALGSAIYDEGTEGPQLLPFKHSQDDVSYLKAYELKYLKKLTLKDLIGDIEGLGIQFDKEDFEDPSKQSQLIKSDM